MTLQINDNPYLSASYIQKQLPNFKPKLGIVLGSGLSKLADELQDPHHFSYEELPGFPKITVHGHFGRLSTGYIGDTPVVFLAGRAHSYEGDSHDFIKTYVRTLKLLGCEYFIATNASGSLREDVPPGSLMMITDHINLQPSNPLVGENDDRFGPRFLPLDDAYDKELQAHFRRVAERQGINLAEGVYISVLGPNYETAAEIRAFKYLGADAVGMSTVPEVLVANHCGMKVAVIATITNFATGLDNKRHSHDDVVAVANQASLNLSKIITEFVKCIHESKSI